MSNEKVTLRVRSRSPKGFNRAGIRFSRDWQEYELSPEAAARIKAEGHLEHQEVSSGAKRARAVDETGGPAAGPLMVCPNCGAASRASLFEQLDESEGASRGAELMPTPAHAPGVGSFPGRPVGGSSSTEGGVTHEQVTPRVREAHEDTAAGPADPMAKAAAAAEAAEAAEEARKAAAPTPVVVAAPQAAAAAPAVVSSEGKGGGTSAGASQDTGTVARTGETKPAKGK